MDNYRTTPRHLEDLSYCLNGRCDWWPDCWKCGFDRDEDARRKKLLKTKGLSKGKKGLWTLKIVRGNTEMRKER